MWILKHLKIDGFQYFVNPNQEKHVVGRQEDVSLPLAGDQTISRVHAVIYINEDLLEVLDEGSKYKVFLNNNIDTKRAMIQCVRQPLKEGDRILFGRANHLFQVQNFKINVTASTLEDHEKKELATLLLCLGGEISESISPSTSHLVMPSIIITSKLVFALIHCIPIVTIDYWRRICDAATNNETFPDPKEYLPSLKEVHLRGTEASFDVNLRRKSLFKGKTFVFLSQRQYDVYRDIILGGGGKCQPLKAAGLKKTVLVVPNTIVIRLDSPENAFPGFTDHIVEELEGYVRAKDLRFVPSNEINLAVIHASTEKYCNPRYKFEENVATQSDTQLNNAQVLVGESVPMTSQLSEHNVDTLLLPESMDTSKSKTLTPKKNNQLNSQKRKIEAFEAKFAKRRKIEEEWKLLPRCPPNKSGNWINKSTTVEPVVVPEGGSAEILPFDLSKLFEDDEDDDKTPSTFMQRKRPAEDDNGVYENGDNDADNGGEGENNGHGFAIKRKKLNTNGNDGFGIQPKTSEHFANGNTTAAAQQPIPTISLSDGSTHVNGKPCVVDISLYHQPIKISASGWLSASFGKLKVKDENEDSEIPILDSGVLGNNEEKKEQKLLIDDYEKEAEDGFVIEVKPMVLESKSFSTEAESSIGSSTTSSGRKNFKAFQKKRNYNPQTHLLPTVSVQLGLSQRMMI